ncbi:hypothetical protein [uncultured Desulfobacter sp.]|uniref:hypothetical protein n=1 Tax=uncultured Desulfobacter sp. TaxID=240139 RepID=UPI0029F512E0|nr:hypothetical protein [uncultured Desulfobacter sp.]
MRDLIKKAIGETVQDMINLGFKSVFTEKELNLLGVTIHSEHYLWVRFCFSVKR